jgi:hypothetical protein
MTRFTRFVTACALTGALVGAAVAACGGRPGSPGELPPMAPHPGKADPTALPLPRVVRPTATAGSSIPVPEFSPVVGEVLDAGVTDAGDDAYSPPLPPLADSGVPADSRLEPRAR